MLRTALLILSGNAFASLLLLVRNLMVARLIPVADYGIASTLGVAMAVVEMMSALGLQQQIIQAKEGDDPHFQAALQGFQLLRGVISGGILFLLAYPMARFFAIPEAAWAYQVMAAVPVLNALGHFDIHRLTRAMMFWPMMLSQALPALISLLVVWPLALWLGDYRVMLCSIVLQAALGAATSHLLAKRPYRVVFDRRIIARSLRFGWPILINGILMFLVFNGDKMIVGRTLGMETLAVFSMGVTLTLTPTLVLASTAVNFFLPQLSIARHEGGDGFNRRSIMMLQSVLSMSLLFLCGTILIGPMLVHLLIGEHFDRLLGLLGWFAILQTLRVLKTVPSTVAVAVGQTTNPMIANIPRVLTLPVCWYVATHSGSLLMIIWVATLGELVGYLVAMMLMHRWVPLWQREMILPNLAAALFFLAAVLCLQVPASSLQPLPEVWAIATLLGLYGLCLASQRTLLLNVRNRNASEGIP